jgi:hypothetical protein
VDPATYQLKQVTAGELPVRSVSIAAEAPKMVSLADDFTHLDDVYCAGLDCTGTAHRSSTPRTSTRRFSYCTPTTTIACDRTGGSTNFWMDGLMRWRRIGAEFRRRPRARRQ